MSEVKMSDDDILYCLQTISGYEPDDIECDEFEIAVNDDQFAQMSIVRSAWLGAELIGKLTEQNKMLQEQIVHERIDKHAIITNHLNVLAECIKSVPVPEHGREHNIKMRDAILNVMASSVEGIR